MRKKRLTLLIGLLAALLTALLVGPLMGGTVSAQALEGDEVTATVLGPETEATVGDPLELTLVVTHPAGYHVIAPELGEQWGDFLIRSESSPTTAANADGTETTIIVYDGRLFMPGQFNTPPLPVTVTDGAGRLIEVTAPPTAVTINSVLVEGDSDLRDIKPQADLPLFNILPWLAGGLLLALAAGGYLAWRRHQAALARAAIDNRLPHEVALDELTRIAGLGLPEQTRFKEHYSLVSDTVRLYLERIYGRPMTERTTGEIARELQTTTMDRGTQRRVLTFLQESDLVKFADIAPSEAEAYELVAQGRMIVESTLPRTIEDGDNGSGSGQAPVNASTFTDNGHKQQIEVSV